MNDCVHCFIFASLPMMTIFYGLSPFKTTPFLMFIEVSLTMNSITLLLASSTTIQPSLQMVLLNLLTSTKTSSQRYCISLYDGTSHHKTLLLSPYNAHVVFGSLSLGSIIILKEVSYTFLQSYVYVYSSPYY